MSSNTKVSPNLLGAQTLEQMLEVVPQLGEFDSLEAVPVLAGYDRRSRGWLTVAILWLANITMLVLLMATVIIVLFLLGDLIVSLLIPTTEELIGTANAPLLQVLRVAASVAIVFFIFNAGPRRWLVSSTGRFKGRIRLRLLLLRAIKLQLERNRRLVDSNWRRAVCKNCLARLDRYTVRFAYWRWLTFARCRKCFNDQSCYTRVRTIAGWLDHEMNASQEQAGEVVKVNMLHRLPPRSLALPIDLEELVIADVEDEDVEILIFLYRSQQPKTDLPKPKRLRCRLTRNSTVSLISRRQLKQNFSLIT